MNTHLLNETLIEHLIALAFLIPLAPLLAAGLIALRVLRGQTGTDAAEPPVYRIAQTALLLALAWLLALDALALIAGEPGTVRWGDWFVAGTLPLPLGLTLDALSLSVATGVALIGAVVLRFSASYLHREPGFQRFFLALCLFLSGMLLIVLSGNAVLAFVGWELAGVSSWMLIGYAYERHTATENAGRAFLNNRIGDAGFLLGIALAAQWVGAVDWASIHAARLDTLTTGMLTLGFVVAALAKSAQIPFAPWIARALEGPTPSSAVFYGAVMVHAGVYLLLRLEPLLVQVPALMSLIALMGGLTALYGWLSGLTQTDIKSSLMFSVTTQVGLMFLAIGLGLFTLAAVYMGLHALFRAWQFLASPGYMHAVDARPALRAPTWLAQAHLLYTAALQRFWLEPLLDALLVRPTLKIARDIRHLDEEVVSRLVGLPPEARASALTLQGNVAEPVVRAHGIAGALLVWSADHLDRFETRLLLQGKAQGGGVFEALGQFLNAVESLLEKPRYLLLLVMATFVVIL